MLRIIEALQFVHVHAYARYVMSIIGTSLVAMTARAYNVPVLVCCETYKALDLDSFFISLTFSFAKEFKPIPSCSMSWVRSTSTNLTKR